MLCVTQDFFGSSKARKLIKEIKQHPDLTPDVQQILEDIVGQIFHETCTGLYVDAIDFLLL